MENKPSILFAIPNLGAGGAQRIISFLAHNINPEKFEKHLLVVGKSSKSAYETDESNTTFLNKSRVLYGIPSVIYFLYKYKPDIVFSCLDLNVVFGLVAPFFPSCKFIIREASVVSEMGKFNNKGSRIQSKLSKIAFKNADAVVCQSKDMANDFIKLFSVKPENVFIINNPITEIFALKNSSRNHQVKFITIGRLSKEKGHLRLLEGMARLKIPFTYTIIGSGSEEENIRLKIAELGMENIVRHIPFTNKIGRELRNHDFYLQGSYVEGFPNALLESCVAGVPVIAFRAPGGTKEIIEDGINGYLAADQEDFVIKLKEAINRKWDPAEVSQSVITKFSQEKIIKEYETLFAKILNPQYHLMKQL